RASPQQTYGRRSEPPLEKAELETLPVGPLSAEFGWLVRGTNPCAEVHMKLASLLVLFLSSAANAQATSAAPPPLRPAVAGSVREFGSLLPVPGARLTLFTGDLAFFREVRSDASGAYLFAGVPPGTYRLGAAARGFDYQEIEVAPDARLLV